MNDLNQIVFPDDIDNFEIPEEEVPDTIAAVFENVVEYDRNVQIYQQKCDAAKDLADKQIKARTMVTNHTAAINSTQDAVRAIIDAQDSLAKTQRLLFENQQKMAAAMRYLLLLGSSSIAMSRLVIAKLEGKLKKASQEELSDIARQELIGVIKLLREQESAFSKQDRISEQLSETVKTVKVHEGEIVEIKEVDRIQTEKDIEHDELIAENATKNIEQDAEILRQMKEDEKHDVLIKKVKRLAVAGVTIAILALILAIIGLAV